MAFLGFMKGGKQQPAASAKVDPKAKADEMPLPPSMDDDPVIPGFSEEKQIDDLKLPEVPDISMNQGPTMPDQPQRPLDDIDLPDMPDAPQIDAPDSLQPEEPLSEMPQEPLPTQPQPMEPQELEPAPPPEPPEPPPEQGKKPEEPYEHTPAPKMPAKPRSVAPKMLQEFYIKGEDYRELLIGLDLAISKQKEKIAQPEKDVFSIEEKEYTKFILTVEDIHKRFMLAESILFEERRET